MSVRIRKDNTPAPNGTERDWAYISFGETMSAALASKLEKDLESDPMNLASRLSLLGYYGCRKSIQEKYYDHMLWMIDERPGDYLSSYMGNEHHSRAFVWKDYQIREASIRWKRQVRKYPQNVEVLCNAASFFEWHHWPTSEKLYKKAKKVDPRISKPARQLAYQYRYLASIAPDNECTILVRKALREADEAIERREKFRGDRIGVLEDFAPLAIKFGYYKQARKFAKRLQYYGETAFVLWEQEAFLYLAWLDLLEERWRGINFKLERLKDAFEEQPSCVASSNAAVSFVADAIHAGEEHLAIYALKILIRGSSHNENRKECAELQEWCTAISENRNPKLQILNEKLKKLY